MRKGVLHCTMPIPANGEPGRWQVRIFERASGNTAEGAFSRQAIGKP